MTTLNIKYRKNTTKKAIEELQNLIDSFDGKFLDDINIIESGNFYAKIEVDNDQPYGDYNYRSWFNYDAFWRIENGTLEMVSTDNEDEVSYITYRVYALEEYQQINFAKCIEALENVISKYNKETEKKDKQLEKFLDFCSGFRITK